MVPLDGRQEDLFYLGLDDFMRTVGAEMVSHALLGRFQRHSGTEEAGLQRRVPGPRGRYPQSRAAFFLSGFSG